MRTAGQLEQSALESGPLSAEIQNAVKTELESIMTAPTFSQSNRCKRFLSHIVLETLSGNARQLKERTIGIVVFNRANDYETGDDSVVRVTANEVRKRLGQFYKESPVTHAIQIELPRGSYVPEFRIEAIRRTSKIAKTAIDYSVDGSPGSSPVTEPPIAATSGTGSATIASVPSTKSHPKWLLYVAILIVAVVASTATVGLLRKQAQNRIPDIWASFLHPGSPVLVCIDTHQLPVPNPTSTGSRKFVDMVLRKEIIALDDAAVLSYMGATLGRKEIPFRVVGAAQTSLEDLRRQPVILIGAIDNKWTIRLTQDLRYRIEVANPPNSGATKEPVASIIDSQHPDTQWSTDLSVPFDAWKSDYAVIAKLDDTTTGVPVLIEAGLGNDGTLAANELITSGGLAPSFANEPSCRGKRNFEAVIETQIIDTKSGPPRVLRLACW